MRKKIVVSGTGCALADYLYSGVKFSGPAFLQFVSRESGDGGLSPGKLVFTEELERFASLPYNDILHDLSEGKQPCAVNIGGPGLVSLIHASQLLDPEEAEVRFYGGAGKDDTSEFLFHRLKRMPLNIVNYLQISDKKTPFTHVFSDASYDNHQGERTFINHIGAAWDYSPEHLDLEFFGSDIVCFGGTALVPQLHDHLTDLLVKAKDNDCITVVNTVFDFRNEKRYPGARWPLGDTTTSLKLIDLLIMDCEEALKISGKNTIDQAADFFVQGEASCFIITNGSKNLYAYSNGALFERVDLTQFPISGKVSKDLIQIIDKKGDTTGCGDNFVGGAIYSLALQLSKGRRKGLDFGHLMAWAVASGGFTCFYLGGTYFEQNAGEKKASIQIYADDYLKQIFSR